MKNCGVFLQKYLWFPLDCRNSTLYPSNAEFQEIVDQLGIILVGRKYVLASIYKYALLLISWSRIRNESYGMRKEKRNIRLRCNLILVRCGCLIYALYQYVSVGLRYFKRPSWPAWRILSRFLFVVTQFHNCATSSFFLKKINIFFVSFFSSWKKGCIPLLPLEGISWWSLWFEILLGW